MQMVEAALRLLHVDTSSPALETAFSLAFVCLVLLLFTKPASPAAERPRGAKIQVKPGGRWWVYPAAASMSSALVMEALSRCVALQVPTPACLSSRVCKEA